MKRANSPHDAIQKAWSTGEPHYWSADDKEKEPEPKPHPIPTTPSKEEIAAAAKVSWFWKLPIVRHIRYCWHCFWLSRHIEQCRQAGLGIAPQEYDLRYLECIWEGRA